MKKSGIISLIILILLAGAAVWFFGFRNKEKPVILETENPQYGYISKSVTATGTIQPVDTVSVGTQVSGTIKYLYADFNSTVKQGQLIAELDKSLFQAQVDQYKANLDVAQSQLVFQKSTYDRQNLLFQTGAISKQDYESALYQYNTAKANVASVQAQLQAALKNLSYTNIYSPIKGVILSRNVNIGQTVAASFNTPTLFIIAKDITKMQVQAAVDEADIGNVTKGQRVTFTVDAYPDDVFQGTVQEIRLQPTVSANVVTYTTIINAPNDNMKLKPGMTANIIVYTAEQNHALLIPAKAIKFKPDSSMAKQFKIERIFRDSASKRNAGGPTAQVHDTTGKRRTDSARVRSRQTAYVWIKHNDTLQQKKIRTGLNDDTNVEVLSGLSPDDEVITDADQPGSQQAKTGAQRSPFMPQRPGRGGSRRQ